MGRFELTVVVGTAVLVAAGLILVFQCSTLITRVEDQVGIRVDPGAADVTAAAGGRH